MSEPNQWVILACPFTKGPSPLGAFVAEEGSDHQRQNPGQHLKTAGLVHNSALFLDRDGVINVDGGYVHRPDQFEFVPGIFELARFWTNELRRPIVVVTNQSGIGRGYFDENAFANLTRWMCDRFAAERTAIVRVYHCPYHPVDGIGEYVAIIRGGNPVRECSCRLHRTWGSIPLVARLWAIK
jgi:HAD superfamily hydrolase (TIGR01662 family)